MTRLWPRTICLVAGGLCGAWTATLFGILTPQFPLTNMVALGATIGAALGAAWPDRIRMPILGWIAAVPCALLGWSLGAAAGILIALVGERMCPDEYGGSSGCGFAHFQGWEGAALMGGSAIACFLFVLLPALAVPSRRRTVALIALVFQIAAAIAAALALRSLGAPIQWEALTVLLLSAVAALWLVDLLTRRARTGAAACGSPAHNPPSA